MNGAGSRQSPLSARLAEIVESLPLGPGMRVLEIGGAPGAAAKAVCRRIAPGGHVLVIDRSAKGVDLTIRNAREEVESGAMSIRRVAVEELELLPGEQPFDLAFAVRVGALDGRHPHAGARARERIRRSLAPGAALFVDGGDPLRRVDLAQV